MNHEESSVNDREWADDRNWHLGHLIYFSRNDTRLAVPKWESPRSSWTLNFARPASVLGVALLLVFTIAFLLVAILATP